MKISKIAAAVASAAVTVSLMMSPCCQPAPAGITEDGDGMSPGKYVKTLNVPTPEERSTEEQIKRQQERAGDIPAVSQCLAKYVRAIDPLHPGTTSFSVWLSLLGSHVNDHDVSWADVKQMLTKSGWRVSIAAEDKYGRATVTVSPASPVQPVNPLPSVTPGEYACIHTQLINLLHGCGGADNFVWYQKLFGDSNETDANIPTPAAAMASAQGAFRRQYNADVNSILEAIKTSIEKHWDNEPLTERFLLGRWIKSNVPLKCMAEAQDLFNCAQGQWKVKVVENPPRSGYWCMVIRPKEAAMSR
jgi:hypothetical protein